MRNRITITIRRDLLLALDSLVDGERIRNRSHALEYLLARSLAAQNSQAVILASGRGVKMRPFTYETPKSLIPVHGRPLLEHTISQLRGHGIRDIVITVSHLAHKIQEHFQDGSRFGVSIRYVHEPKPTGTGGALWQAKEFLHSSPFLLVYGDVLLDLDLTELMQAHQQNTASVTTLALASVADPSPYGAVRMRGTRIVEFIEKPPLRPSVSHLVFAGCAVLNQQIFDYFPARGKKSLSLEKDIFPRLINQEIIHGYPFEGQWFDVSTPVIYAKVLKNWQEK